MKWSSMGKRLTSADKVGERKPPPKSIPGNLPQGMLFFLFTVIAPAAQAGQGGLSVEVAHRPSQLFYFLHIFAAKGDKKNEGVGVPRMFAKG